MRIDLFAVWFMSGLMSRQLEQTPVFKVVSPQSAAASLAARLSTVAVGNVTPAHSS